MKAGPFPIALFALMASFLAPPPPASADTPPGAAKSSMKFDDFDVSLSVAPRGEEPGRFEVEIEFVCKSQSGIEIDTQGLSLTTFCHAGKTAASEPPMRHAFFPSQTGKLPRKRRLEEGEAIRFKKILSVPPRWTERGLTFRLEIAGENGAEPRCVRVDRKG